MTSNVSRYTERQLANFASSPRYTVTDARPLATRIAGLRPSVSRSLEVR